MSKRRKAGFKNRMTAYIAAGLVHAIVIGAMIFNFTNKTKTVEAFDAEKVSTVKASLIDESKIKDQQDKLKKLDQDKKRAEQRERDRLEQLKRDAEREKKKIAELKDQQKQEEAKALELEQERKEIALKKKKEEEKRKKELAAKKKKDEAEKARKKKLADDRKRKEELERIEREAQEYEAQQRLNKLLEEEERLQSAQEAERRSNERTTTVKSKYAALIKDAIKAKWRTAPGTESWREAKVNIKLSSRGEVLNTSILRSSGSESFDRSAITAILQASPLPFPTPDEDPTAHNELRSIILTLKK